MSTEGKQEPYVVVARRYRPQRFSELIGQEHVSRALSGAITKGRVGHAYLFTGARGVGKTSAARILAKALNCEQGPSAEPCNACDICQAVSAGDDLDVLEIDGASNRGIDEIRQLKQNVNVRPGRARYKIYIIDEVHMLTREAFNALLKTLEEPPKHVKFIFCTTEPEKVPVTVLSRCQRFDFAGIQATAIVARLRQIVEQEGLQAETEALEILARRAAGSMRDSQSLLEQLLAFGGEEITAQDVHRMLGTAASGRLITLLNHLVDHDAAQALVALDGALAEGVDVGQLMDQLLGYLRDAMAAAVGCQADLLLHTSPSEHESVTELGHKLGVETILALMQILDQSLARMRVSTQRRVLAELALVRMCSLENLEEISGLIRQMVSEPGKHPTGTSAISPRVAASSSASSSVSAKKKPETNEAGATLAVDTAPAEASRLLTAENVSRIWQQAIADIGDMTSAAASQFRQVAILAPNHLVVYFPAKYSMSKSLCERPQQLQRIEGALAKLTGQRICVDFKLDEETAAESSEKTPIKTVASQQERLKQAAQSPLVQRAGELFGAIAERVDEAKTDEAKTEEPSLKKQESNG